MIVLGCKKETRSWTLGLRLESRPRPCPEAKDLTLKVKAWMSWAKASKILA